MPSPLVAIVMGSDSDWTTMDKAAAQLDRFAVGYEVAVLSAHRSPEACHKFAASARERGLKVLIAGAGMSAALAGTLAAMTTLPVIGVPVTGGALDGLDALLSTVQMPPGVPVATVGLGAARNAAILAAEILALGDDSLAEKLVTLKEELAREVASRSEALQSKLAGK